MSRYAIPLCLAAAAVLAACGGPGATRSGNPTIAAPAPQQIPYTPGTGVVQSVSRAPMAAAATAGATADPNASRNPAATTPSSGLTRLGIRMDNGRMVYVDTPSNEFRVGDRVSLDANRQIKKM